ncbi:MAG: hypothetical protein PHQ75_04460, partial [Thermoguttaceae bacterium]|nr:hypothetical protein [Thermoguttaceae bacterium]
MNYHYRRIRELWDTVRDCYTGTIAIKHGPDAREYLPVSAREKRDCDSNPNRSMTQYELRKRYAIFENIFKPTIDDMVGLMQKNPPHIAFGETSDDESPREVRDIDIYGNLHNDGLKGLKWRLNFHQVLFGRYGLLLDLVTDCEGLNPRFSISEYPAASILDGESIQSRADGRSTLNWALLDESKFRFEPKNKSWEPHACYRVLALDHNGEYYQALIEGKSIRKDWLQFDLLYPPKDVVYPAFKQRRLNFIPLTVCNVNKLGLHEWQEPPFLDVAHIAIGLYQVDSLYKKALWNFASPTLSVSNADRTDKDFFLGDAIWPRSSGEHPVTVSLLETSGVGLAEMRRAKEEMKQSLKYTSIRELLDGAGANASGQAIQLRAASGTACVAAIDQTGSRAIEEQLVYAAIWAGATNRDAAQRISYHADTSYLDSSFQLSALTSFIEKNSLADAGQPLLSKRNIYSLLEKTLPNTLTSFEDNEYTKQSEAAEN